MPVTVLSGPVIQAGQSLSDALDCRAGQIRRITMPTPWTPANISFQISGDGIAYSDLFSIHGQELMVPVVPGASISTSLLVDVQAPAFIKFRSGSRDYPVVQEQQATFAIAIES